MVRVQHRRFARLAGHDGDARCDAEGGVGSRSASVAHDGPRAAAPRRGVTLMPQCQQASPKTYFCVSLITRICVLRLSTLILLATYQSCFENLVCRPWRKARSSPAQPLCRGAVRPAAVLRHRDRGSRSTRRWRCRSPWLRGQRKSCALRRGPRCVRRGIGFGRGMGRAARLALRSMARNQVVLARARFQILQLH